MRIRSLILSLLMLSFLFGSAQQALVAKSLSIRGTRDSLAFIGTTANSPLSFRVNNEPAGFIYSSPGGPITPGNGGLAMGHYAGENLIKNYITGVSSNFGNNILYGYSAGRNLGKDWGVSGKPLSGQNTYIGLWSGYYTQITNGGVGQYGRNVGVGESTLFGNVSGGDNTAVGAFALEVNDNGDLNTAVGRDALRSNVMGSNNTAVGPLALGYASTGVSSCTITEGGSGYTTASITFSQPYHNSPGVCYAYATGTVQIDGDSIVGITITNPGCGYTSSLNTNYTGYQYQLPTATITGDGVGATVTVNLSSANYNIGIGLSAGIYARMAQEGIYIGTGAGISTRYKDTGNIMFGRYADIDGSISTSTNIKNAVAIGYNAKVAASNTMALGGTGSDAINVGINTIAARKKLDVVGGDILVNELTIGRGKSNISTNTAFGFEALDSVTTSVSNVAIGYRAAKSLTSSYWNIAIGGNTLEKLKTGTGQNVAVGGQALNKSISGVQNVAIGVNSLYSMTGGVHSTAIGSNSFFNYTSGSLNGLGYNTGLGSQTAYNITTGEYNTIIGAYSGFKLTTGHYNIAIGLAAMGGGSTFSGGSIGSSSSYNIAIGLNSLINVDTGGNNIAIGLNSLQNCRGFIGRNIAIGRYSGSSIIRGDYNVVIGSNSGASINGASRQIIISDGEGNERMRMDSVGNVGIGTTTPDEKLHVVGNVKIVDGYQAAGKVLTSDANGLASWQPTASTQIEGSYTPTLFNTTNITATTAYAGTYYYRQGNIINVFGKISIDATTALTMTEIGFDLPISTSLSDGDLVGTCVFEDNTTLQVTADVTNGRAKIRGLPQTGSNNTYTIRFTYKYQAP